MEKKYKLVFANQAIDSSKTYTAIKENKVFLFLRENTKDPIHIFKVARKSLKTKCFHIENNYSFDVPTPISLIEFS